VTNIVERLSNLAGALSGILIFCIGALVMIDVATRTSGHSIAAVPDWIALALVWSTLLGFAYAHRYRAHVNMDLVLTALPARKRRTAEIVVEILTIATLVIVLWSAIESTRISILYTARMVSSHIPIYVYQLALVVGVLLFLLQSIVNLMKRLRAVPD
jgi:TRAP-type C4-dicarboxylate transport system permease small subunit